MEHTTDKKSIKKVHFSLTPSIYAAKFENSIIILDSKNDSYISLIDDAADFLDLITQHPVLLDGTSYTTGHKDNDLDALNHWIQYFKEEEFITECTEKTTVKHIAPEPKNAGGLIDYKWDTKLSWKPFKETSFFVMLQAFWLLVRVHRIMKKTGIAGLKRAVTTKKILQDPQQKEMRRLSAAVDAATLLYPKKTYCLAWAATFVLLAQKKGFKSQLTIGVQTNPFYAHAWAEVKDWIIHDDPNLAQSLSIIFKEPH